MAGGNQINDNQDKSGQPDSSLAQESSVLGGDGIFEPKLDKIRKIAEFQPNRIEQINKHFSESTNVYIDLANVLPWANKLGWKFDIKRLKQFFDSFPNIKSTKLYTGTLLGDENSERFIKQARSLNFDVITKPVKLMKISIDVSSISMDSPALLSNFIRGTLLKKLDIETIITLNSKLKDLNSNGILHLEDRKCNFDVEMGTDIRIDCDSNKNSRFVLWTGDSDFAAPSKYVLDKKKNITIFATARRISRELNELRSLGLEVFEIKKIKNFICWNRYIDEEVSEYINSENAKGTPEGAPKLSNN